MEGTIEEFRIQQVVWGVAGFGASLPASFASLSVGVGNPLGLLCSAPSSASSGCCRAIPI